MVLLGKRNLGATKGLGTDSPLPRSIRPKVVSAYERVDDLVSMFNGASEFATMSGGFLLSATAHKEIRSLHMVERPLSSGRGVECNMGGWFAWHIPDQQ